MRGEIMTGWVSAGGMELSRMTVAALDDLGYSVNYAAADKFDVSNLNSECVKELCGGGQRRLSAPTMTGKLDNVFEKHRVDNDSGQALALAYGKASLEEMTARWSEPGMVSLIAGDSSGGSIASGGGRATYVGDESVSIIYEDDAGEVRSVAVTKGD